MRATGPENFRGHTAERPCDKALRNANSQGAFPAAGSQTACLSRHRKRVDTSAKLPQNGEKRHGTPRRSDHRARTSIRPPRCDVSLRPMCLSGHRVTRLSHTGPVSQTLAVKELQPIRCKLHMTKTLLFMVQTRVLCATSMRFVDNSAAPTSIRPPDVSIKPPDRCRSHHQSDVYQTTRPAANPYPASGSKTVNARAVNDFF